MEPVRRIAAISAAKNAEILLDKAANKRHNTSQRNNREL
jgi:hypothetical protein